MRLVSWIVLSRKLPLVVLLLALASCGGNTSTSDSTSAPATTDFTPATGGSIKWKDCDAQTNDSAADTVVLQCSTLKVPYTYSDPKKGMFTLKLVMRPANIRAKRIGSLLVNPGGPGFGGTFIPENANGYLSSDLLDRFDVVAWDPRGTGESTPFVDCIDNYDKYFTADPSPTTDAQKQKLIDDSQAFDDACEKKNSEILPYISTRATAQDMDTIRAALGEKKITYFGFSYGSELGATWATMFPSTVRAAVLDGAADPTADYITGGLQQAKGFESELTKFLAACSANKKCKFYNNGDAEHAYDKLMIELDAKPLVVSKDRAPVNTSIMMTAVSQAMYTSTMWPELEAALANAQKGNGSGLLSLYDDYYQRKDDGSYGNELEAFLAISCLDDPGPKSVKEVDSFIPELKKVAPRLADSFAAGYWCALWPIEPDSKVEITGKGAGPIVVVGTTGDAATPLASSRKMASTLEDGRLIVVTDNRHTGYGSNECVIGAVDSYLITTKVSFAEKAC